MGKLAQVQTAVASSFGVLLIGALYVWPSYTLGSYKDVNGTVLSTPMTDFEASMLGSIPSLGAMVGTGVVGLIIDALGRKRGGIAMALPFTLSWALIEFSSSSTPILIGRFLGGASGGAFMVYAPIFISEVAEDCIRGTLASAPMSFYCCGALFSYLMGWFLTYHMTIWVMLTMSVCCALFLMTVTESPTYLMRQNKEEEARAAIAHYRGLSLDSKEVLEEVSRLRQQVLPAVEMTSVNDNNEKTEESEKEKLNQEDQADVVEAPRMSPFKMLFAFPSSRRGFIVVGTALSLQVCMGIVPVQVYAKDLFSVAVPNMSSHVGSALFAIITVAGCSAPSILADRAGRRFLIILSSVMVGTWMLTLGVLLQTGAGPAWLTAVVILAYCFFFNFGAGTIPYVLLAETFVPEVQSIASMLLVEWVWFLNFVIIGIFPYFTKYFGFHGMCYVFAAASAFNTITSYLLVPETKGLSNQQIQEALLRRKK